MAALPAPPILDDCHASPAYGSSAYQPVAGPSKFKQGSEVGRDRWSGTDAIAVGRSRSEESDRTSRIRGDKTAVDQELQSGRGKPRGAGTVTEGDRTALSVGTGPVKVVGSSPGMAGGVDHRHPLAKISSPASTPLDSDSHSYPLPLPLPSSPLYQTPTLMSSSASPSPSASAAAPSNSRAPAAPPSPTLRRFSSSDSYRSSGTANTAGAGSAAGTSGTSRMSVMTGTTAPTEAELGEVDLNGGMPMVVLEKPGRAGMARVPSRKGKERAFREDDEDRMPSHSLADGRLPRGLEEAPDAEGPSSGGDPPQPSPGSLSTTKSGGGGVTFELATFPPSYSVDQTVSRGTTTRPDANATSTTASHLSAGTTNSRTPLFPTDAETRNRLALLGYSQELNRDWDLWSSISLTTLNIGTLQGSLWGLVTSMFCGGPIVMSTGAFAGGLVILTTIAVLGEFASAYPVAGAMFTWVFKLARASDRMRDWARFLSWITGSFLLVVHLFIQVIICWQLSTELQGTINGAGTRIGNAAWVQFLLALGFLAVSGLIACAPITRSPALWKTLGLVYLAVYIIGCVSLVATSSQHNSLGWVFSKYTNSTGYDSRGFVYLLGWAYTSLLVGSEAAAHMAEETKQPAKNVPLSMFLSALIAYVLTWIGNICVLVALPTEDGSIGGPGNPVSGKRGAHVWEVAELIYSNCPRPFAILILSCTIFLQFCSSVAQLYAATRYLWSLARDSAIPFAGVLRRVHGRGRVPRAAALVFTGMCMVLSIPILATFDSGGTLVVSAIFTSSLYFVAFSYLMPIIIYLTCPRDVLHVDGRNTWTLRQWSRPLACVSIALVLLCVGLIACPTNLPVTAESWSWSPAVLIVAAVLSSLSWVFYGNSHYAGPIKSITLWTTGREVGLPKAKTRSRKTKTDEDPATTGVVKDKTTTMGKGATAAIFEGSLPTVASDMEYTYWTESGGESGWTETSETSRIGHETDGGKIGEEDEDTVGQRTQTTQRTEMGGDRSTANRRSFPRTDST